MYSISYLSKYIFLILILILSFAQYSFADPLTLGVFPRRNAQATVSLFQPIAEYLSKSIGRQVNLVTAKDFDSFWKDIIDNKFDIVHFNQYDFLKSYERVGYDVILKNEEYGAPTIAAGIVVRKDSGIHTLNDLKGRTILFGGGKRAMIAYIVNTALLRRAGLNEGDYVEKFAKNPPNAAIATYHKQADAAGIGDVGLKIPLLAQRGVDVNELTFIAVSEPLPHLPWAVNKKIDMALKAQIQSSLLKLNDSSEGKAILSRAKLTGLIKSESSEYEIFNQILNEVFPTDTQ